MTNWICHLSKLSYFQSTVPCLSFIFIKNNFIERLLKYTEGAVTIYMVVLFFAHSPLLHSQHLYCLYVQTFTSCIKNAYILNNLHLLYNGT